MDDPKTISSLPLRGVGERGSTYLLARARTLRRQSSDAESLLWRHLRARRLMGYKFRRQMVIEPVLWTLYAWKSGWLSKSMAEHSDQMIYDARRTVRLESMGYRVMRFWNHQVLGEHHSVLEQIRVALIEAPSPQPSPDGRGS